MEIISSKTRVGVQYEDCIETLLIGCSFDERGLIQEILPLFKLQDENWEYFEVIIKETNSRVRYANHLQNYDILILKKNDKLKSNIFAQEKQSSKEILISLQRPHFLLTRSFLKIHF